MWLGQSWLNDLDVHVYLVLFLPTQIDCFVLGEGGGWLSRR